jgi:hypothetical protein
MFSIVVYSVRSPHRFSLTEIGASCWFPKRHKIVSKSARMFLGTNAVQHYRLNEPLCHVRPIWNGDTKVGPRSPSLDCRNAIPSTAANGPDAKKI